MKCISICTAVQDTGGKMKQKEKSVSPMSNQARSTWSRQQLTMACLNLLKKKPLEEITVSELCDLAGTGRVTFYRNYRDMTDIIRQYLFELNKEWTDRMKIDGSLPLDQLVGMIMKHFEDHRDFYELLNSRHLVYLMKDVIMNAAHLKLDGNIIEAYSSAYIIYLLYGWIEVWFERGMKDSSQELMALLKGVGNQQSSR